MFHNNTQVFKDYTKNLQLNTVQFASSVFVVYL